MQLCAVHAFDAYTCTILMLLKEEKVIDVKYHTEDKTSNLSASYWGQYQIQFYLWLFDAMQIESIVS